MICKWVPQGQGPVEVAISACLGHLGPHRVQRGEDSRNHCLLPSNSAVICPVAPTATVVLPGSAAQADAPSPRIFMPRSCRLRVPADGTSRAVSGSIMQKSGRRSFYLANDDSGDRQPRFLADRRDPWLKQELTAVG